MTRRWTNGELWLARVGRTLRVATYAAVASATVGLWSAHAVYADVKEAALRGGMMLTNFPDLVMDAQRLRINGELVHVASATTDASVTAVLDRIESHCTEETPTGADPLLAIRPAAPPSGNPAPSKPEAQKGRKTLGLFEGFRQQKGELSGTIVCFARGANGTSARAPMLTRINRFLDTGNLGEMGDARYVVARQMEGGGTHVVTAWTEGSLYVNRLLPATGDASGGDTANAIRPPEARRLMEATVEGAPYAVRIYETPKSPNDVMTAYDDAMPNLGWESSAGAAARLGNGRAYSRGGADLIIVAEARSKATIVSVVEMRGREGGQ